MTTEQNAPKPSNSIPRSALTEFVDKFCCGDSRLVACAESAFCAFNNALLAAAQDGRVVQRKAYVCASCEGVYADDPVTQCDCVPDEDVFIEGVITYAAPQPK